jgi:hypothetical protein
MDIRAVEKTFAPPAGGFFAVAAVYCCEGKSPDEIGTRLKI